MAENTGAEIAQIEKDTDRDNWMSADEAKDYGLVDEVIKLDKEARAAQQEADTLRANKNKIANCLLIFIYKSPTR